MMPEKTVSKVMRSGLSLGLLLMLAGVLLSLTGSHEVNLTMENFLNGKLMTKGVGLLYLGTLLMILTPVAVLIFLAFYYAFSDTKKYSVYCLIMIAVLIIVVLMRFSL
ncbi:MAG: hypothetical protein C0602_04610 [Denitrovibrio sp.]|nr:MAG: hypothetical protein C0602_04610 [Denitrovibrio sp.]